MISRGVDSRPGKVIEYGGFKIQEIVNVNSIINRSYSEYTLQPVNVSDCARVMFYRRIYERRNGNRFDTLSEARNMVNSCCGCR